MEQAIARFEKRLDEASDALQSLGKDLGRGTQAGYKDVTAAMRKLRRDAEKVNRQALKDFDKLRAAVTPVKPGTRPATGSRAATSTKVGTQSTAAKPGSGNTRSKPASGGSRSSGGSSRSSSARSSRSSA